MKNLLLFVCCCAASVVFFSCKSVHTTRVTLNGKDYTFPMPPNTVRIGENLYADVTELDNIRYKEYLFWLAMVFGKDSETYLAAVPDSNVWLHDVQYGEPYRENYHSHPAFDMYPAVGISYEQALDYTSWRSDRVFEMMLIREKKLNANQRPDIEHYFSIQRYFEGKIPGVKPDKNHPYPEYRLPTPAEWEKLARGKTGADPEFGLDLNNRAVLKYRKTGKPMFNTSEQAQSAGSAPGTKYSGDLVPLPATAFFPNDYGIYNAIGNVGEMTSEKGVSKGGSWKHPQSDCAISKKIPYEGPAAWLGFRNVCSWKLPAMLN